MHNILVNHVRNFICFCNLPCLVPTLAHQYVLSNQTYKMKTPWSEKKMLTCIRYQYSYVKKPYKLKLVEIKLISRED